MLKQIIHTLNSIEVKGRDNLDKLLGCILMLEQLQSEMDKPATERGTDNG